MKTILGNELKFKTYNFLKVNDTTIEIPELSGAKFNMESDDPIDMPSFSGKNYSISEDVLNLNLSRHNLYRTYVCGTGEKKAFEICNIVTNDLNCELVDTHDISVKENASGKIVIDYSSKGSKEKFRSSLVRVAAGKNSQVDLCIIQREEENCKSLESISVITEEGAVVNVRQFELGAGKLYLNYDCKLEGKGSQSYVNSVYFGSSNDELNLLYNMFHSGEKTVSDILVNGALKDRASKFFKSNLDFLEGSAEAVGSEEEYALLLSDKVNSVSVPLMLCHEDNVQGNHAASAGKVDPDVLFYLMSRGFSQEEAEAKIIESKFASAIDTIDDKSLQDEIWEKVRSMIRLGD